MTIHFAWFLCIFLGLYSILTSISLWKTLKDNDKLIEALNGWTKEIGGLVDWLNKLKKEVES